MLTAALESKRLELLHEVVPKAATIGIVVDPESPDTERQLRELPIAAKAIGQRIVFVKAGSEADVEAALVSARDQGVEALLVASSPRYLPLRQKIVELAARGALPAIYFFRDFAAAGGLMSYGTDLPTPIAKPDAMRVEFSKARRFQTCRSCNRPKSSW